MAQIQWFPGHMAKARREITEKLKLVDIVLEIVDARVPLSSRNPMMGEILKDKPTLVLLNKTNLADKKETLKWIDYFKKEGVKALDIDLIDNYNVNKIIPACNEVLEKQILAAKEKGYSNFKIRALVVGIPNVGKSTFINTLAKRKAAVTGDKPGVTKSQTWIKINNSLELLDTPGILWPKFENEIVAHNLALCGAIKDDILPLDDVISFGLSFMQKYYPDNLNNRYGVNITSDMELLDIYEVIGRKRNCLLKGNQIDYDRVVNLVLFDLRHNKLGAMSYDRCSEYV
jgi:ribosome biogenesis GTPase A